MKKQTFSALGIIFAGLLFTVLMLRPNDPAEASPSAAPLLQSGSPTVVSYQGYVEVSDTAHTGSGYFKFAVVDSGSASQWSNDGTSAAGSEPTAYVTLTVTGGLFNVLLGDTSLSGMTQTLSPTVFDGTDRYLRVWFSSDGSTFDLLSPDRQVAAVPYALQAEEAANADTLDTLDSNAFWQLGGNGGTTFSTDYLGTSDAVSLTLGVSGAAVMTLDTAGNVGLGTTSPTELLEMTNGDLLITQGDPISTGHIDDGDWAYDIYVSGAYAYLANYNDGLRIYDITDPTSPQSVGHIDDGGIAYGIYVSGAYAYLANGTDGLRIYDVSDPTSPQSVGHIDNGGTAYGIYVSGSYAYLANNTGGLRIYDVTDPTSPQSVGNIDDGGNAYGIYVSGSYAYLANFSDGLRIYDITDPTSPQSVGHIDNGSYASDIYVSGSYAYLANLDDGLRIYDITDPSSPQSVGHIDNGGQANGIYVSGSYAYLANYAGGLRIYDITDPTSPQSVGHIRDEGYANGIYVSGSYAYLANYGGGLRIYEISGVHAPSGYVGAFKSDNVDILDNLIVGNDAYVRSGLTVGSNGIWSGGDLSVAGYVQLDTVFDSPPATDCDAASEEGRMKFDPSSDVLYICSGASGWVSK